MTKNILITGVSGEVGCELVKQLVKDKKIRIFGLDIKEPTDEIRSHLTGFYEKPVLNQNALTEIIKTKNIDTIYHLAALLSTSAEMDPYSAHNINVQGTFTILKIANQESIDRKSRIKFFFPSSIAVYGLTNIEEKRTERKIAEEKHLLPITMYGINKLYCEQLGTYMSSYFQLLSEKNNTTLDFRCIRFPGLISAHTLPSGGTSDYVPEMIHAAVSGKDYASFARDDTVIPFMAMPDAIRAAITLMNTPSEKLHHRVYNIRGFSASAEDFRKELLSRFPKIKITYKINMNRQKILDSWPEDVDDQHASSEWGWKCKFGFKETLYDYLLPILEKTS
jgi:threonine 3-dehydrogenase